MRLKFAIIGSSGSGKTTIANLLGNEGVVDSSGIRPPYRPTHSVRIVEFSVNSVDLRKYNMEVDIQLWEIGGSPRLKAIWPGVQNNLDGVILVYDVNNEVQIRDASAFHMHFVTHSNSNVAPSQCLIIGNIFRGQREIGPQKIIGVGPRVRHIAVNVDDDSNFLKEEFKSFMTGVAQIVYDREKANIMTLPKATTEAATTNIMITHLSAKEVRRIKNHMNKSLKPGKEKSKSPRLQKNSQSTPVANMSFTEAEAHTAAVVQADVSAEGDGFNVSNDKENRKLIPALQDTEEEMENVY